MSDRGEGVLAAFVLVLIGYVLVAAWVVSGFVSTALDPLSVVLR